MMIDCISDLHGHYPKLEGGDLLVVAGDLTANDMYDEWNKFDDWIRVQKFKYKKVVVIAGNHDSYLYDGYDNPFFLPFSDYESDTRDKIPFATYLCDSGTEFEYWEDYADPCRGKQLKKLKIYGSPWTLRFEGMNPHYMAFTVDTEEELAEKWALIPDDVDILVTHSPAWGNNDTNVYGERCGSKSLCRWVANHAFTLKLHVHGHIHEGYGVWDLRKLQDGFGEQRTPMFINASHVNASYEPVNKPIRVLALFQIDLSHVLSL